MKYKVGQYLMLRSGCTVIRADFEQVAKVIKTADNLTALDMGDYKFTLSEHQLNLYEVTILDIDEVQFRLMYS